MRYARRHPWTTAGTFVMYGAATVLAHVFTPMLYERIIDTVSGASVPADAMPDVLMVVWMLGATLLVYNILYRVGDYCIVRSQSLMLKDALDDAFGALLRHSAAFFANNFGGSLISKAQRFTRSLETMYDISVFKFWMHGIVLVGIFFVLLVKAPIIAGLLIVWLAMYIAITYWFIKRRVQRDLVHAEAKSKTTGVLADAITNMLNMKMFARTREELAHFAGTTHEQETARRRAWLFHNYQNAFAATFILTFQFASMYVAVRLWGAGSISAGTIVLVQIYAFRLFDMVLNLGKSASQFASAFADAREMIEIMEEVPSVLDPEEPEQLRIHSGEIAVRNISFGYTNKEGHRREIFTDFSMHIRAGERVGLVGHSGSGKSTITKLILRFMDVDSGSIEIDGQNIAHLRQDDLRSVISYVPQEPILFHRSLLENIRYGRPEASDAEVYEAARLAHAHDFISAFPDGYETMVGERGVKLSGGERQRVAIARAILKNAPILILDEATSALDSISEREIQAGLEHLMQGKTVLVIAHRLSTVQKMDRIIVFEYGKVTEEGTHDELIKRGGHYARLWQEQAGGYIK